MASGLPDFQIPINITAQTLEKLAVDIVAQTIGNLGVNIKAQDLANLSVDIAAQTLSALGINITAQDLSELIIKINAQAVGIYLQPEWAALIGVDKNLCSSSTRAAWSTGYMVDYTVPAGKTLYINHFGAALIAVGGNIWFALYNITTTTYLALSAGVQGNFVPLNKPVTIPGEERVVLLGQHSYAGTTTMMGHIGGYEI